MRQAPALSAQLGDVRAGLADQDAAEALLRGYLGWTSALRCRGFADVAQVTMLVPTLPWVPEHAARGESEHVWYYNPTVEQEPSQVSSATMHEHTW